jgi:hypothetical protein
MPVEKIKEKPITYHCGDCGSDNIRADASVKKKRSTIEDDINAFFSIPIKRKRVSDPIPHEWVVEKMTTRGGVDDCTCPSLDQIREDTPENISLSEKVRLLTESRTGCPSSGEIEPYHGDKLSDLSGDSGLKHGAKHTGEYGRVALIRYDGGSVYHYVQPDGRFSHEHYVPKKFRDELARPINAWAREMGIAHACDSELDIEQFFGKPCTRGNWRECDRD